MKARDLMTPRPACVSPGDSVQRVAQLMKEHDCGCLPVVGPGDQRPVLGVITDRDIALRVVAQGRPGETPVGDVMTTGPDVVRPEADLREVERVMTDRQVRRVVVVDDAGEAVGIIAQADLARAAQTSSELGPEEVGEVLERISRPQP